jgi:hypothetical protein
MSRRSNYFGAVIIAALACACGPTSERQHDSVVRPAGAYQIAGTVEGAPDVVPLNMYPDEFLTSSQR